MLKQAQLTRSLKDQLAQCRVCEHYCTLTPGEWGKCGIRTNQHGEIYLALYGRAIATHVDPIEKKPLYHFLPGSRVYSVGTYGCNMRCQWCQNWQISQVSTLEGLPETHLGNLLSPQDSISEAQRQRCKSIAYTYNEPTVFFEYTYDTAKIAHKHGLKNIYVSNGFMSPETLEALTPYLDGINVDLKGFTDDLYRTYSGARLEPIKRNIAAIAHETDIWLEVTTLIIPDLNDGEAELRSMAAWLADIDPDIPWHVSAFHPDYQLQDRECTPLQTLQRAYEIGKRAGLHHVYLGNVLSQKHENTYCPQCHIPVIQRYGFHAQPQWTTPGICPNCGTSIAGVW